MTTVRRRAHAKLNVFLRVLGRRADGFHDVETLVLPLELHDVVEVSPADELTVDVSGPRADDLVAAGGEQLVERSARRLAEACGEARGARIGLDKRIPVGAGLGGGSADAAAALVALRELWSCESCDDAELAAIGAEIGSDVPAALRSPEPAYCSGRGERVHRAHAQVTSWAVRPFPFAIRSADAYAWWDEDGGATGPDAGALVAAVESGNNELMGHALVNDLQAPAVRRHPEIAEAIAAFLDAGALGAIMTGSGPTVVALARHPAHADQLAEAVGDSFVTSGPPRTMTA